MELYDKVLIGKSLQCATLHYFIFIYSFIYFILMIEIKRHYDKAIFILMFSLTAGKRSALRLRAMSLYTTVSVLAALF